MPSNNNLLKLLITLSATALILVCFLPNKSTVHYFQPERIFIPYEKPLVDTYYDTKVQEDPLYNITGFKVALGCAITSHTAHHHIKSPHNLATRMPLLRTLVPSFCKTASQGFDYTFYVSYDIYDPCFSKEEYMIAIQRTFNAIVSNTCPSRSNVSMLFVRCHHNRHPAWAQNDAMMQAYLDHVDYYYRVNDDTRMLSPGWTEAYIIALLSNDPPNVGVVGPFHKGGNEAILTYDFVHRTHIDIFGSYYPRVFTDWWADNWISDAYGIKRTKKLPMVRLVHTGEMGTRYEITRDKDKFLDYQIALSEAILKRYLNAVEDSKDAKRPLWKRVVSMSLWGSKPKYVYGAIRNANLIRLYFPHWTLRIYTEKPDHLGLTRFPALDERYVRKLQQLGAEVVKVDYGDTSVAPLMWRFMVADDEGVDAFIVRDADTRLSERDSKLVKDWLENTTAAIHCVRDHPKHAVLAMLGGLWGGRPRKLKELMKAPFKDLMMGLKSDYTEDSRFLSQQIWPSLQNFSFCHDSVSCDFWNHSYPFPFPRIGSQHVGQMLDAFDNVNEEDAQALSEVPIKKKCTPVK